MARADGESTGTGHLRQALGSDEGLSRSFLLQVLANACKAWLAERKPDDHRHHIPSDASEKIMVAVRGHPDFRPSKPPDPPRRLAGATAGALLPDARSCRPLRS